jgi:beta-N-acetylhexosaminidase
VLTDDLEMGAIMRQYDIETAAVQSVQAGCDVILVCHTPARQLAAHSAIVSAVRAGAIDRRSIEESVARIEDATGAEFNRQKVSGDRAGASAASEG